jgi:hypothetical protein
MYTSVCRLLLGLSLVMLLGCAHTPRWVILAQASPDPLVGAQLLYVEPIHFDHPRVGEKPEAEYLGDKTPEQRDSWDADKADTSKRYIAALMEACPPGIKFPVQPAPGVLIVRPIITFIEPGFWGGIVAAPTQVAMRVQILTSEGVPVHDFTIRSVIPASMVNPGSGTRMRQAGEDLGRVTADYIKKRGEGVPD